jgi:hypothetical protein
MSDTSQLAAIVILKRRKDWVAQAFPMKRYVDGLTHAFREALIRSTFSSIGRKQ